MKKILLFTLTVSVFSLTLNAQTIIGKSNSVYVDYSQPAPTVAAATGIGVSGTPKYHALIIGVSEYQYAGPRLTNLDEPVKDANRLKNILVGKYEFAEENTHVLENPTREELINAFDQLIHSAGNRDNLLIFYAGHGFYDKGSDFGFWLPANAKSNSRADWIANSTIKDYVKAIPTKHTLLVTDACFGGSIFKTRSVNNMDAAKVHELYRDKSRKAITSGNLSEVPDKSFFIEYLLKVLSENEQDYLPASSLFTRLYEPVMNNSPTVPQFGVIQGAGDEGGDFIFIKKK